MKDIGKLLYIVWKTLRNVSNDYFAKELPQIRTQLWFNQNIRSNLGHIVNNGQQFAVLHASVMPFRPNVHYAYMGDGASDQIVMVKYKPEIQSMNQHRCNLMHETIKCGKDVECKLNCHTLSFSLFCMTLCSAFLPTPM